MDIKSIGLTETEFKVYKILINSGESLATAIIKKSQLHRTTVYDVLNRLIEKGLVSYFEKNKKKYYTAQDPKRFKEIIDEKKKILESDEESVNKLIAELSAQKSVKGSDQKIQILEGKEGLKTLMTNLLDSKEFLIIGGNVRFQEIVPAYTKHWASLRERKKVYARILTSEEIDSKWKYNVFRKLPKNMILPTPTIIFNGKVAIVMYDDPITILTVSDVKLYQTYQNYFEMQWANLK